MHNSASACRLSVCPYVCNVGGSGLLRLEILETNCNLPNTCTLCSPKAIHLLRGERGEILRRLEAGGKSDVLEHKSSISLKRVKIEEKILWRAYRKSPTLFRKRPSPTPIRPPLPQDWGFASHPILQSKISGKRVLIEK